MAFHVNVYLLVVFLILCLALLWHLCWIPLRPSSSSGRAKHKTLHHLLKPRTPRDCPACCLSSSVSAGAGPSPGPVRPWSEGKSRRGAPKRIDTEGFACPNPQCPYYGITDVQIHALVGDGKHGYAERIQTFRGPACRTTFTRPAQHAPLPAENSLAADRRGTLGASRGAGPFRGRAGFRLPTSHDRDLALAGSPCMLIPCTSTLSATSSSRTCNWTNCEPGCAKQVLWLWLAIDPRTKILPVLYLGPRTQHAAHMVIHSLRHLLVRGCVPLFTSDGLNLYFYALTAHFGQWLQAVRRGRNVSEWQVAAELIYGQVKKSYRQRKLVRVTRVMRLGTEDALTVALQRLGFSGKLNTAFIERVNLTVRHGVAALARRTWATAQQPSCLLAHMEWWRAYYHFVRPHASLRVPLLHPRARGGKLIPQCYRQRTPAMAAGRTNRRWTTREVLSYPLPLAPYVVR